MGSSFEMRVGLGEVAFLIHLKVVISWEMDDAAVGRGPTMTALCMQIEKPLNLSLAKYPIEDDEFLLSFTCTLDEAKFLAKS